MKKLYTFFVLLAIIPMTMTAQNEVTVNGLRYELDKAMKTVTVTSSEFREFPPPPDPYNITEGVVSNEKDYKGDIVIPSSITYKNVKYKVTGIGMNTPILSV